MHDHLISEISNFSELNLTQLSTFRMSKSQTEGHLKDE